MVGVHYANFFHVGKGNQHAGTGNHVARHRGECRQALLGGVFASAGDQEALRVREDGGAWSAFAHQGVQVRFRVGYGGLLQGFAADCGHLPAGVETAGVNLRL